MLRTLEMRLYGAIVVQAILKRTLVEGMICIFSGIHVQNEYVFNLDDVREEYALTTQERFKHYIGNRIKGKDFGRWQTLNKLGIHPDDWWQIQPIMLH